MIGQCGITLICGKEGTEPIALGANSVVIPLRSWRCHQSQNKGVGLARDD